MAEGFALNVDAASTIAVLLYIKFDMASFML